jgi:hypothetical protein
MGRKQAFAKTAILSKPFTLEQLVAAVGSLVEDRPTLAFVRIVTADIEQILAGLVQS